MTMNQKLLTVAIAAALLAFLIIAGMLEKKTNEPPQPLVDRTLEISDSAIGSTPPPSAESKRENPEPSNPPLSQQNENKPMEQSAQQLTATLHTEKGDIVVALHADKTPKTVDNFVTLAKKDFYDNTVFHRTIKGFMIQGGDPKGDGTGGPGYTFADEPFAGAYTRGIVAMANAGPNTNGSQFFIMHADYQLPKNYVIFGNVIKGMDVVDAIATAPTEFSPSGEHSKPVNPVTVKSVEIEEVK